MLLPKWLLKLLNRAKLRRDVLVCMRQEDTYRWPDSLGRKTPGECSVCGYAVYFEEQNSVFVKVCNRCAAV